MSRLENLPILRVVQLDDLVLHEETDPQRVQKLKERLRRDGVLKNPPIVAPMEASGRYVVLDGANRVAALRELGVRDAVVQVVDYDEVKLDTWNHLVTGIDKHAMFQAITRVPGIRVRPADLETARRLWARREILAYIVCPQSEVRLVDVPGGLEQSAEALTRMANVYKGQATIYRVQTDDIKELMRYYDNVAAVIIYPPFRPAEILELARNGAKLPTGITRHVIPRRVLRINIPLDFLAATTPVAEKNAWLQDWIRQKLRNKEVRFYEEPTFLFDE